MYESKTTHCLKTESIDSLKKARADGRQVVFIFDADNLLYSSTEDARACNYEKVTQDAMMEALSQEFGITIAQAEKLRARMKGFSGGTTPGAIWELAIGRSAETAAQRPSAMLELLCNSHRTSTDNALLNTLLNGGDEAFIAFSQAKASETFCEQNDRNHWNVMMKRFCDYSWKDDPSEANMCVRAGLRKTIMELHEAGIEFAVHSTSYTPGVIKILKHVMGDDFATIFGAEGERIFGVDRTGYYVKPNAHSYKVVKDFLNEQNGPDPFTVFFDDALANCVGGKQVYDMTVYVQNKPWRAKDVEATKTYDELAALGTDRCGEWLSGDMNRRTVDGFVHDKVQEGVHSLATTLQDLNERLQEQEVSSTKGVERFMRRRDLPPGYGNPRDQNRGSDTGGFPDF